MGRRRKPTFASLKPAAIRPSSKRGQPLAALIKFECTSRLRDIQSWETLFMERVRQRAASPLAEEYRKDPRAGSRVGKKQHPWLCAPFFWRIAIRSQRKRSGFKRPSLSLSGDAGLI